MSKDKIQPMAPRAMRPLRPYNGIIQRQPCDSATKPTTTTKIVKLADTDIDVKTMDTHICLNHCSTWKEEVRHMIEEAFEAKGMRKRKRPEMSDDSASEGDCKGVEMIQKSPVGTPIEEGVDENAFVGGKFKRKKLAFKTSVGGTNRM